MTPSPPPPPSGPPTRAFDPMDVLGSSAGKLTTNGKPAASPANRVCPFCAEQIQPQAIKCKHCGELLDEAMRRKKEIAAIEDKPLERAWNPGIAALLSIIIPGAGQLYKGEPFAGLFYFVATAVLFAIYGPPAFALWAAAVVFAYLGDPYAASVKERAKKLEKL